MELILKAEFHKYAKDSFKLRHGVKCSLILSCYQKGVFSPTIQLEAGQGRGQEKLNIPFIGCAIRLRETHIIGHMDGSYVSQEVSPAYAIALAAEVGFTCDPKRDDRLVITIRVFDQVLRAVVYKKLELLVFLEEPQAQPKTA